MRAYLLIPAVLLLAACETAPKVEKPELRVVERVEYVLRIPPKELLTLPPPVAQIDVDSAKQSDIAQWILWSEERTRILENMLIELATFFKLEKLKLDDEAQKKNDEALKKKAEADAARAESAANPAK
jgi:hypothetical protein